MIGTIKEVKKENLNKKDLDKKDAQSDQNDQYTETENGSEKENDNQKSIADIGVKGKKLKNESKDGNEVKKS